MQFHRNVWYIAALSREVGSELLPRKIVGQNVVLFRSSSGQASAIADMCPHRFAPLSRGTLVGDTIECAYHGLRFDGGGRCTFNPQGELISDNMHVRGYPVEERHDLIWIWPGDPDLADAAKIPDLTLLSSGEGRRASYSFLAAKFRYDILIDNLLDSSHADYLHKGSFSSGTFEQSETKVREGEAHDVTVTFTQFRGPPMPFDADLGPISDRKYETRWYPGQIVVFRMTRVRAGEEFSQGRVAYFAHVATPADADTTNYFMWSMRDYALDDPEVDIREANNQFTVINCEDAPMLEAVHKRMDGAELMDLRPVVLPSDRGALQVRRVMKRLLAAEAELAEA